MEPCPIAKHYAAFKALSIQPRGPCPFLEGENRPGENHTTAVCKLAVTLIDAAPDQEPELFKLFGFTTGCCIKGKAACRGGPLEDIAAMDPEKKFLLASALMTGEVIPLESNPSKN